MCKRSQGELGRAGRGGAQVARAPGARSATREPAALSDASSLMSLGQVHLGDKHGHPYYVPQCAQGWRHRARQVHILVELVVGGVMCSVSEAGAPLG